MASNSISKQPLATKLKVPYRSRSALARRIVDHVAATLPTRAIRVATDGGYATQAFLRALPTNVDVVGRFLLTAKLYQLPPPRVKGQRGAPRKKGALIGSPKTLATPSAAWHPHPQEAGAFIQSWVGIWHSVLPGRLLRVVVVWRPHRADRHTAQRQKGLWASQAPGSLFQYRCVAVSPRHFGDVCRSLGHGNCYP